MKNCKHCILDTLWYVENNRKDLLAQKTYQTFKFQSEKVKQDLEIKAETYDENRMKLAINNDGNKGTKKFVYFDCLVCHKVKLAGLLVKHKVKLPVVKRHKIIK